MTTVGRYSFLLSSYLENEQRSKSYLGLSHVSGKKLGKIKPLVLNKALVGELNVNISNFETKQPALTLTNMNFSLHKARQFWSLLGLMFSL